MPLAFMSRILSCPHAPAHMLWLRTDEFIVGAPRCLKRLNHFLPLDSSGSSGRKNYNKKSSCSSRGAPTPHPYQRGGGARKNSPR